VLFALAGLRRRQITIADLLKMRSGLYNYTDGENSRTQSSPTAFPCPPFSAAWPTIRVLILKGASNRVKCRFPTHYRRGLKELG
jgi:CubicO group peptidase (beta-lactamase class C family)